MNPQASEAIDPEFPKQPLQRWVAPWVRFLHLQSASGLVLLACTAVALVLANSPWAEQFLAVWHLPFELQVGTWSFRKDLLHVINDGLMAVFFFLVGLEIKREIVDGEFSDLRQAALPIFAAVGGMVVPALVYLAVARALHVTPEAARGWAIPMATDIAFVVGILALLGNRAPPGLKLLLLSLAIVDDLGAVLIIAFVFTGDLAWGMLALAGAGLLLVAVLNRLGVRSIPVYVIVGAAVWYALFLSGVHATIAGVALGLMTPARPWIDRAVLARTLDRLWDQLQAPPEGAERLREWLGRAEFASREALSPLDRIEAALHPWVAFGIMPLFALANAGVPIRLQAVSDPLALAIAAGLAVGKPLGIFSACFLAVRLRAARLPAGVTWPLLAGGACLGGIGFTMSLFLASLALPDSLSDPGKLGTLLGSVVSSILGIAVLLMASRGIRGTSPGEAPSRL